MTYAKRMTTTGLCDMDDFPAYYELEWLSNLLWQTISNYRTVQQTLSRPSDRSGDLTVCDAMSNEEDAYGWNAGNTTVTIQNGEITLADRIWVP